MLESQITDKSKKGLGYNVVPPPHPLIYNRPKKLDLSYSGLDEFKEPEFKGYDSEDRKKESNVVCDKKSNDSKENSNNSLVKEQVSKDTSSFVESSLNVDKETVFPIDKKVESVKPKNHEKSVKKSVRYAEMYRSQTPRGNQRNWNGQKLSANTIKGKGWTVNTAHPKSTVFSAKPMSCFPKTAQSTGKPQQDDIGFIDSGCSRHMTGNIAYLSDFKEFDRGYVTFGGGAHGARTPQQNGVAERRNRTLFEAARTMLAESKLPTTFWAEAVSTACYVQNKVLVVKPHNKTPYELLEVLNQL
ncbi:retrovirus-related pol polyprotein from transposon TNT 1-94 [Tanacetum coccineum]